MGIIKLALREEGAGSDHQRATEKVHLDIYCPDGLHAEALSGRVLGGRSQRERLGRIGQKDP
jgi:hypothetical protein